MTTRTIPKATLFILALAVLALPASATITYSYCSSGCSSTGGDYSSWQSATGSSGLSFSMSPLTFAPAGLDVNGVFTDSSGTIFTGYNGASTDALTLSGTSLAQTLGGTGTGVQISLPSNTYAIALMLTTVSGFGSPMIELNDRNLSASNYQIVIPSSTSPQFFGILSDTPINSIFVGNLGLGGAVQINSFELGQSSPTPEAPTLALIGSGLVGLALIRRRVSKAGSSRD
jgi:hypothetical protein